MSRLPLQYNQNEVTVKTCACMQVHEQFNELFQVLNLHKFFTDYYLIKTLRDSYRGKKI